MGLIVIPPHSTDRVAVALLPVVKQQAAQITDMTARLEALASTVNNLLEAPRG